ncbi:MAG: DUF192 domain-containing protein [Spirochaetes bacterium]|nr:DUF192 domain-containing protein [Spirochaetota bacterium]
MKSFIFFNKEKFFKLLIIITIFVQFLTIFQSCSNKLFIQIKDKKISIEIALTPEERQKGLSGRDNLPEYNGMLFVFENDQVVSFWMKDTKIPLSIAFITKDGVIVGIYDMEPFSLNTVSSIYPVRYALEVNKGLFNKLGISAGDTIKLPPFEEIIKMHKKQKNKK